MITDKEKTSLASESDVENGKRLLGFWARSDLPPHLIRTLNLYNLDVRIDETEGSYHLFSRDPKQHPRNMLPGFILAHTEARQKSLSMDLNTLAHALEFLHQPVRVATRHAISQKHETEIADIAKTIQDHEKLREIGNFPAKYDELNDARKRHKALRREVNALDHRKITHHALRFLTTASVDIPVVKAELSESDECHAEEENKRRDKNAWVLNNETGHSAHPMLFDTKNPPETHIKTIPGLFFDPSRGFVLTVHPHLLNTHALSGEHQSTLRDNLLSLLGLNHTSDIQTEREVILTPDQFSQLCSEIQSAENINALIENIKQEENSQARDRRIAEDCTALKQNPRFQQRVASSNISDDAERRRTLKYILQATTAFTSILSGAHMSRLLAHYHHFRRNEGWIEDTLADYVDMRSKIEELLDKEVITPEELQAFAHEYYELLSFTNISAESMKTAAGDQNNHSLSSRFLGISTAAASTGLAYLFTDTTPEIQGSPNNINLLNIAAYALMARSSFKTLDRALDAIASINTGSVRADRILEKLLPGRKDQDRDIRAEIYTKMDSIGAALQSISITGIEINEEHLPEHYQKTISIMRKSLGQDGSLIAQAMDAAMEGGGEFVDDIKNSLRDSRVTQISTAALASYMIWLSAKGDTSVTQAVSESLGNSADQTQFLDDLGFDSFLAQGPSEFEDAPRPPPTENPFSCHMDFGEVKNNTGEGTGVYDWYKHCVFGTLVGDQALAIVDGTEYVYRKVAGFTQGLFELSTHDNQGSLFTESARQAIKPITAYLMVVNWLQNITHAGLWNFSFKTGWDIGYEGYEESVSFLKPLGDFGRRILLAPAKAVSAVFSSLGISPAFLPEPAPSRSVHDSLYKLVADSNTFRDMGHFRTADIDDRSGIAHDLADISMKIGQFKHRKDVKFLSRDGATKLAHDAADIIGGIRVKFNLTDQNLAAAKDALDDLEIKLDHMAPKIGVGTPWYHAMIRYHLHGVRQALTSFEKNGNAIALKDSLEEHLSLLSGFQLREIGTADIFNALTGQEMQERAQRIAKREAGIAIGREQRLTARINNAMHLVGADEKKATFGSVAWAMISLGANHVWDKTMWSLRNAQRSANYITNRPILNYGTKAGIAVLLAADFMGLVPAESLPGEATKALGLGYAGAATGGSFLVFNSGEDILLIHTTAMTALITAGATSAIALHKGIAPGAMASAEALREKWSKADIITAVDAASMFSGRTVRLIGHEMAQHSERNAPRLQKALRLAGGCPPKSRYTIEREHTEPELAL